MLRIARRVLPGLAVFAVVGLLTLVGAFRPLENDLLDARFKLLSRASTGDIVVVAIDSASLQRLPSWPWPRRYYAEVLDALYAAGAQRVVVDIDFSSTADAENDAALEAALARHGGETFLPIFQQVARPGSGEVSTTRPLDRFHRHVQLAAINVLPAADGLIRNYTPLRTLEDQTFPSTAFALAGARATAHGFTIDFAIDPATVASLSFVDVMAGAFAPSFVAGKSVIIGATAVELGDRHAVPVWRNIAGPTLTVIAAESMATGRDLRQLGAMPTLAITFFLALVLTPRLAAWPWRRGAAVIAGAGVGAFGGTIALQASSAVLVPIVPPLVTMVLAYAVGLVTSLDRQTLRLVVESLTALHRRALLDRIINQSDDGVLIIGSGGAIETANPSAYRILGRDEDTDLPAIDTLFETNDPLDQMHLRRLASGDSAAADHRLHELTVAASDGAEVAVEILVSEVKLDAPKQTADGGGEPVRNLICTIRDVTERKRMEAMRRQFMEESLRIARAKSAFFANMNHELRTPLNHIIGFAEVLHGGFFGKLSAKQTEYTGGIIASGQDLLQLIAEILEYADSEDGESRLAETVFEPTALVDEVVDLAKQRAGDRLIAVIDLSTRRKLPNLRADRRKLRQVLLNVLSNGIKFNNEPGHVSIDVTMGEKGLSFVIADDGVGMSDDQVAKALEPFARGEEAFKRSYEGHGLGLPLAKSLIGAHGGEIGLASAMGEGTTVTITLPKARMVAVAPAAARRGVA